jgi:hypothetical protein
LLSSSLLMERSLIIMVVSPKSKVVERFRGLGHERLVAHGW